MRARHAKRWRIGRAAARGISVGALPRAPDCLRRRVRSGVAAPPPPPATVALREARSWGGACPLDRSRVRAAHRRSSGRARGRCVCAAQNLRLRARRVRGVGSGVAAACRRVVRRRSARGHPRLAQNCSTAAGEARRRAGTQHRTAQCQPPRHVAPQSGAEGGRHSVPRLNLPDLVGQAADATRRPLHNGLGFGQLGAKPAAQKMGRQRVHPEDLPQDAGDVRGRLRRPDRRDHRGEHSDLRRHAETIDVDDGGGAFLMFVAADVVVEEFVGAVCVLGDFEAGLGSVGAFTVDGVGVDPEPGHLAGLLGHLVLVGAFRRVDFGIGGVGFGVGVLRFGIGRRGLRCRRLRCVVGVTAASGQCEGSCERDSEQSRARRAAEGAGCGEHRVSPF